MIRTRFAPSPTGYLHIGGARTALYSWLFARQNHGEFVLRIEDTDTERSTDASAVQIIESMKYLGLAYNGDPIFQSQRLDIYQKYAKQLVDKGLAYEQEGAIYFKSNSENITVHDLIIGDVTTPGTELKDFVIQKSNGWPVFHFAVVIDDALMGITHVIRGMDHLSNTPKHIQLFQALEFEIPQFAHIPMILGADKQRLSKRHGAQGADEYQKLGIIPEALINFLARLGWGYESEEIFTIPDLLKKFDLTHVSKNPAVFDPAKLLWINAQHIRMIPIPELIHKLNIFFSQDFNAFAKEIDLVRVRCQTLYDIQIQLNTLIHPPSTFEQKGIEKHLKDREQVALRLTKLNEYLKALTEFSIENLEQAMRACADALQVKGGDLIHPLRLALTGVTVGPGIFELMNVLDQSRVIPRIDQFIEHLPNL